MARHEAFDTDLSRAHRRPLPGQTLQFAKKDRQVWYMTEDGIPVSAQPEEHYQRAQMIQANANAATVNFGGFAATPTLTGANALLDNDAPWIRFATTAVLGNASGLYTAFDQFRSGWYPRMRALVKTRASIADVRLLVGFFSASADTLPTNIHGAYFRYATGTGEPDTTAFWRTCTATGTAPTVKVLDGAGGRANAPIAASTAYILGIDFIPPDPLVRGQTPTRVLFSVATDTGDPVFQTETATIPAMTQNLGFGVRVITDTAGAKEFAFSRAGFVCST